MTESRQQRRARERAERKAATRPGPNFPPPVEPDAPPPPESSSPAVAEVILSRFVADDDPNWVDWHAEWGLQDDSVGITETSADVAELVRIVVEELRGWSPRIERIEWTLEGDPPPGQTIDDAVAAAGVTLPDRLPGAD